MKVQVVSLIISASNALGFGIQHLDYPPALGLYPRVPSKKVQCTLKASGKDDSPQIEKAFRECTTVVIPEDQNLLLGTKLNTTGLESTHIRLLGKITVKDDVDYWRNNAFNLTKTTPLLGSLETFYDARIQNDTLRPPHFILAYKADNMIFRNFKIRQSPRWTILVHSSKNVLIHDLDIRSRSNTWALGRESNRETDGVDIYDSDQITLHNLKVDNGDDCVSFKPNATNIFVSNIWCNGTHGVSVGSLGEYNGVQDIVRNVYVNNVTIQNSENGPRIKTWGGAGRGYGYVDQIVFSNFNHINNDSPLTIDNCYKTNEEDCTANPSKMTISNVYFTNQAGSSSGKFGNVGAAMVCSIGTCSQVWVNNLNITVPSECGSTIYANRNLDINGNAASLFNSTAPTYGAGGIQSDNSTNGGDVYCSGGSVFPVNSTNATTL
ncbi:pectin lyase fold/virulence factor [Flagelloscypha sp. PMI_526]|nr:pectin lyase fold/virulence factor [Flagelloscypha sp. PMI_526]